MDSQKEDTKTNAKETTAKEDPAAHGRTKILKRKINSNEYQLDVPKTSKDKIKQPKAAEDGVLPKLHFSMLIIGSSGSGKSVLAYNIINKFYAEAFDMVILISPTGKADDVQAALNIPKSRVITDMRKVEEVLEKIKEVQTEKIEKDGYESAKNLLIYFDDIVSNSQLMNSSVVIDAFIKNRHYKCSTILCSQYYKAIPRRIRMQSSMDVFFECSETEMVAVAEDWEPPKVGRRQFLSTLQPILAEPYQFITVMTHAPWAEKIRKGLTEIIHF